MREKEICPRCGGPGKKLTEWQYKCYNCYQIFQPKPQKEPVDEELEAFEKTVHEIVESRRR
jgi:rRNA maturation endonuclease Nob1